MTRIDMPDFWERAVAPRLTETDFGRAMLSLRAAVGWARAWRLAPWIVYGESLPVRDEARRAA